MDMEFADRIKTIITVNNLTGSSFADKVGVQRSGVSHILNGRNQPSMDFLLKVLEAFPRVDAGWLLTGKAPENRESKTAQSPRVDTRSKTEMVNVEKSEERTVEKIVIFYSDHTFETYKPKAE